MFSLSQATGYCIVAMSCMDEVGGKWTMSKDIAERIGISQVYLSKLLNQLHQSGLIDAKRGYRGGFVLAKPASQISLLHVAYAIEGEHCLPECFLGIPDCDAQWMCPTHEFWKVERKRIEEKLRELTIADVHVPDDHRVNEAD